MKSVLKTWTSAIVVILLIGGCFPVRCLQSGGPRQSQDEAVKLLNKAIEVTESQTERIDKAYGLLLIASLLTHLGMKDRAAKLLSEASALMRPVDELGDGLSKNLLMFPIAGAYLAANSAQRAEEILDEIVKQYEDMAASPDNEWRGRGADGVAAWLAQMAPLYLAINKRQKVRKLIDVNYDRLTKMDHWLYRNRGVGQTAMAYAAIGERERAVEVAKTVKPGRSSDEAWAMIAVAFAQAGDLERAFEIVQSKGGGSSFGAAYVVWIARRCIVSGQKEKALALIQQLASHRQMINGSIVAPFGEISIGWAEVGEFDRALLTAKQTVTHFDQLRTLTTLAPMFYKAGRVRDAERLAAAASKLTGFSKDSYFQARDLREVADAYAAIKQTEKAARLLSQALKVLAKSHDGVEDSIRVDVALSYASMGMNQLALQTVDAIANKAERVRALVTMATQLSGIRHNEDKGLQPFGPFSVP